MLQLGDVDIATALQLANSAIFMKIIKEDLLSPSKSGILTVRNLENPITLPMDAIEVCRVDGRCDT